MALNYFLLTYFLYKKYKIITHTLNKKRNFRRIFFAYTLDKGFRPKKKSKKKVNFLF